MDSPRPRLRGTVVLAAVLVVIASAAPASAQCPKADAPNTQAKPTDPNAAAPPVATLKPVSAKAAPDLWKVGEPITIRLAGTFAEVTAACLDGKEDLTPTIRSSDPAGATDVSVRIPRTDARPALDGYHTITLRLAKANDKTTYTAEVAFSFKPVLNKVRFVRVTKDEHDLRIRLEGEGFFKPLGANYRLRLGGRQVPVCWTEEDCKFMSQSIVATFEQDTAIVLSRIDPETVIQATESEDFELCYSGALNCSNKVKEVDTDQAYWIVRVLASLVVIGIIMLVIVLVWSRDSDELFHEKYLTAALFLDKETGTYSLSRLQFYVWTLVGVFSYAYLYFSRMWFQSWGDLPALPAGLPGIVAIAGGAAVGSQVITQMNGPKGSGELHPRLSDFISSGGMVTPERVQFFVWTIVGAGSFILAVFRLDPRTLIELPSVPESVLAISGISAFGYLGGKLARSAGPVINEVIIRTGPDPDLGSATQGGAPGQASQNAAATATTAVQAAKAKLQALVQTAATQAVFAQASTAITAAEAALAAAQPAGGSAANRPEIDTQQTRIEAAVVAATQAAQTVKGQTGVQPADVTAAEAARDVADSAAKAIDALVTALGTTPAAPAGPNSPAGTKFGILELRGRTLSQDATFHISKTGDPSGGEVKITFDMLEPAPGDAEKRQRPRIVARDDDSGADVTLAKHIRLVIRLNDVVAPLFQVGTEHTVLVKNPDSQSVAYKFNIK